MIPQGKTDMPASGHAMTRHPRRTLPVQPYQEAAVLRIDVLATIPVPREQEANQGTVVQADICRHIRCYRAPRELGRIERRRFARRRDDVGRPPHGSPARWSSLAGTMVFRRR